MNALATCRDCTDDVDHCHDTLIVHTDGHVECTSTGCYAVVARHVHVIACAELAGCSCGSDR